MPPYPDTAPVPEYDPDEGPLAPAPEDDPDLLPPAPDDAEPEGE